MLKLFEQIKSKLMKLQNRNGLILIIFMLFKVLLSAQGNKAFIEENYSKLIFDIPMRDGKTLHTIVYRPKDISKVYPILMNRTCYSIAPYEADKFPNNLGPNQYLMRDGYIFVYQDVRGRYMSEGEFTNMTPNISGNDHKSADESSDTYDSIDWLLKNLKGHNGKVGMWGISYPGYYAAAAIPDAHPALLASSPQAPIADFFFDDFHHNGAFLQSYLFAFPVFGYQKKEKTTKGWYSDKFIKTENKDGFDFNLKLGSLKNVDKYYGSDNFFWRETVEHPNYDEFWQKRNLLPHLKNVKHAVMTVGGLFDAEDLYGPLNIYKNIEKNCPKSYNTIVMGPWSHGDWYRENGKQIINHIYFGDSISSFYQREIEKPFFDCQLKGVCDKKLAEAFIFDSGKLQWSEFTAWPPKEIGITRLNIAENGLLKINGKQNADLKFNYVSDPKNPIPYRSETEGLVFTPRAYMTDDQRHCSKRTDVLTFQTEILAEDFTLTGEILAKLQVAINNTDADFIVKIIDVFPDDHKAFTHLTKDIKAGGYQMLVRSEIMRGRFRESFESPKAFEKSKKTAVNISLQDIHHTFKKGHRVMIQIQSSWFPLFDRNPQSFVPNIYKASEKDFKKAKITIFGDSEIIIGKLK